MRVLIISYYSNPNPNPNLIECTKNYSAIKTLTVGSQRFGHAVGLEKALCNTARFLFDTNSKV